MKNYRITAYDTRNYTLVFRDNFFAGFGDIASVFGARGRPAVMGDGWGSDDSSTILSWWRWYGL